MPGRKRKSSVKQNGAPNLRNKINNRSGIKANRSGIKEGRKEFSDRGSEESEKNGRSSDLFAQEIHAAPSQRKNGDDGKIDESRSSKPSSGSGGVSKPDESTRNSVEDPVDVIPQTQFLERKSYPTSAEEVEEFKADMKLVDSEAEEASTDELSEVGEEEEDEKKDKKDKKALTIKNLKAENPLGMAWLDEHPSWMKFTHKLLTPVKGSQTKLKLNLPEPEEFTLFAFSYGGIRLSKNYKPYLSLCSKEGMGNLDEWSKKLHSIYEALICVFELPVLKMLSKNFLLKKQWIASGRVNFLNESGNNIKYLTFPHSQYTSAFVYNIKVKKSQKVSLNDFIEHSGNSFFDVHFKIKSAVWTYDPKTGELALDVYVNASSITLFDADQDKTPLLAPGDFSNSAEQTKLEDELPRMADMAKDISRFYAKNQK